MAVYDKCRDCIITCYTVIYNFRRENPGGGGPYTSTIVSYDGFSKYNVINNKNINILGICITLCGSCQCFILIIKCIPQTTTKYYCNKKYYCLVIYDRFFRWYVFYLSESLTDFKYIKKFLALYTQSDFPILFISLIEFALWRQDF